VYFLFKLLTAAAGGLAIGLEMGKVVYRLTLDHELGKVAATISGVVTMTACSIAFDYLAMRRARREQRGTLENDPV
jgi:hypothetical protein